MAIYAHIDGFCPACGQSRLIVRNGERVADGRDRRVRCTAYGCHDPQAAHKVLQDPEIHHIVRFNPSQTFNVKHPLRERIDGELLDCHIHGVVQAQVNDGQIHSGKQWHPVEGTWRLVFEPTWLEDPEFGGDPFSWEKLA